MQMRPKWYCARATGRSRRTLWLQGYQALLLGTGLCQCICRRGRGNRGKVIRDMSQAHWGCGARIRDRSAEGFATAAAQELNLGGKLFWSEAGLSAGPSERKVDSIVIVISLIIIIIVIIIFFHYLNIVIVICVLWGSSSDRSFVLPWAFCPESFLSEGQLPGPTWLPPFSLECCVYSMPLRNCAAWHKGHAVYVTPQLKSVKSVMWHGCATSWTN